MTAKKSAEEPKATDAAVEHAEATGVDISSVKGSGAEGRVTKADVVEAAGDAPATFSNRELAANKLPGSRLPSESGDPQVHLLIAQREAHVMNLETLEPPESRSQIKYHREQIDAIDKQLRDLGYKV